MANGTDLPRVDVGGLSCNICTIPELVDLVGDRLRTRSSAPATTILCVNAHIFNLAWEDEGLRERLNGADVLALDGMSMVWAVRRRLGRPVERCNMTEAFRAFLQQVDGPVARTLLIGLDQASVSRAAAEIARIGGPCQVTRAVDGFASDDTYRDLLRREPFDLVLVGCGTPRSEAVVSALAATGRAKVIWHVGGGTLRFLAGDGREAPAWMRRTGTQWLHRLTADPRGMWRRYLVGNPRFVWRVARGAPAPTGRRRRPRANR